MYPIFSDGNYVKAYNDGETTSWWSSSSSNGNVSYIYYVSNTGSITTIAYTSPLGGVVCFRVGQEVNLT